MPTDIKVSYYLVKRNVTAPDSNGDTFNYRPGAVLSDFELNDHIKSKIREGDPWYTQRFEPLTEKEAKSFRIKATVLEGKRKAPNGQVVDPPWDDFIGLSPKEITDRMKNMKMEQVELVRQYERAGMNRSSIIHYTAPSEREPFTGFNDMGIRDVMDKMDLLDDNTNNEIMTYEMFHQKRPAIIEYTRENERTEDLEPVGAVKE